jgi:hypothetical protein
MMKLIRRDYTPEANKLLDLMVSHRCQTAFITCDETFTGWYNRCCHQRLSQSICIWYLPGMYALDHCTVVVRVTYMRPRTTRIQISESEMYQSVLMSPYEASQHGGNLHFHFYR